jgi:hypothetical protein
LEPQHFKTDWNSNTSKQIGTPTLQNRLEQIGTPTLQNRFGNPTLQNRLELAPLIALTKTKKAYTGTH